MSDNTENQPDQKACPQCGAEMPADATAGLCPVCLMAGAMEPTAPSESERPEPPDIEEVQAEFPQLEILEIVGVGGMGVVYKAKQTALNRVVALKLLTPHREAEAGFSERFTREAQALAAMDHSNIVTVHDFGQAGEYFYLLMEFVDGVNLRQAMKGGKFSPEEALAIVPPICDALQYAHDQGIVHRDIKPENLLLDKAGRVKVADFGIARILNLKEPATEMEAEGSDGGLTAGTALGTPNYMAPEQADAPENVDHRADIYSLGVVFYEMLTGERPAAGMFQPPSSRVAVDVRLDEIVLRALADSPELRWQSATDLRTEVVTIADTPKPPPLESATTVAASAPQQEAQAPVPRPANVWKWVSLGLAILAVPVVILGVIVLIMVRDDPDWNPNVGEAVTAWTLWLGAIGLILAAVLTFVRSLRDEAKEVRSTRIRMVSGTLLMVTGLMLPVLIFISAMKNSSREAMLKHAKIREQQFEMQAANQEALQLQTQLNELEHGKRSMGGGQAAAEEIKRVKTELERAEERAHQATREASRISTESGGGMAGGGRLSIMVTILIGVVSIGLLITGIVFLAKSMGALAAGCGIVLLVFLMLVSGILLSMWGYTTVRRPVSVHHERLDASISDTVSVASMSADAVGFLSNKQSITTGPGSTGIFAFEFSTSDLPIKWTVWQQTRYYRDGEEEPYRREENEVGRGGSTSILLRGVRMGAVLEDESNLEFVSNAPNTTLAPGKPLRILNLKDDAGTRVEVDVELRPANTAGIPMIYFRKCEPELENGRIGIAWNQIHVPQDFDLVLETRGTVAYKQGEDVEDGVRLDFSRRILEGNQNLVFVFPEVYNLPRNDARFPKPWTRFDLSRSDYGVSLFGFNNPHTGHRCSARLKLVPEGTVEEVLPEKLAAEVENRRPGAPLPLPPDGASFVAERHIIIPGNMVIQVDAEVMDRDQPSDEKKMEALVFKTPIDDARGIYLRWRAYPSDHKTHANHYIIDLVAAPTGVIFHRFEGEFPGDVTISSPDTPPLPETKPAAQLDREGMRFEFNLIRAEETVPPGTPVAKWWNVRAGVEWRRNSQSVENAPSYQLPSSGDVMMIEEYSGK